MSDDLIDTLAVPLYMGENEVKQYELSVVCLFTRVRETISAFHGGLKWNFVEGMPPNALPPSRSVTLMVYAFERAGPVMSMIRMIRRRMVHFFSFRSLFETCKGSLLTNTESNYYVQR